MKKQLTKLKGNVWIYVFFGLLFSLLMYKGIPIIIDNSSLFFSTTEMNTSTEYEWFTLSGGETICQKYTPVYLNQKGVGIQVANISAKNDRKLVLEIWNDTKDKSIVKMEKKILYIGDGNKVDFYFSDKIKFNPDNDYSMRIKLKSKNAEEQVGISVVQGSVDDGILMDGGLHYYQIGKNDGCPNKGIFLILLITFIVLLFLMLYRSININDFENISRLDYTFLVIAVAGCVFLFSQGLDMLLTIRHSYTLIDTIRWGKIIDFYDNVLKTASGGGYGDIWTGLLPLANYNIFLYLILAIIMSPVYVISRAFNIDIPDVFELLYFSVILAIAVVYSARLVYLIAKDMGLSAKQSKLAAYVYLSSGVLLLGTVGFTQSDILYVIIVLIALRFYLNGSYVKFSLLMSVAIMFKLLPFLLFVPFILLVEKRLPNILCYLGLGLSCTFMCSMYFSRNVGYSYTKMFVANTFNFTNRIFQNGISAGLGTCSIFVVLLVLLCIWCFDKDISKDGIWKWIIIIPIYVYGAFTIFVYWHPQWISMIMPFVAILLVTDTKRRSLIYCEWGVGILFCIVSAMFFTANVDNYMINYGILPVITDYKYTGISLNNIINNISPYAYPALYSMFIAILLYMCYVGIKDVLKMDSINKCEDISLKRGLVMLRIASMYAVFLIFLVMYFYVG